jgi:hypothetical protein
MSPRLDTHERTVTDVPVQGSSDRSFGIVFTVLFVIIGLWPLLGGAPIRWWSLIVAALFLIAALARPQTLAPLNRLWTRFGFLLHRITNPIIMGLVFFLAVTPTALIMRALGKDLLHMRLDRSAKTYWIERQPPGPPPETMKQQF